jgi:hypothetical protein
MWRTGDPACPSSDDRRSRLSSTTSVAGHPFLLVPLTVAALTRSVFWTAVIAASTSIPLLAITIRNVRRGRWSDHDVSRHDQRSGLYHVGLPLIALTALILYLLGADAQLIRGTVAAAVMLTVALLGNRWLKISMHMMAAALCAVWLIRDYRSSAFAIVAFVAALAWSRRHLRRHTWAEIVVGTALGAITGAVSAL